VTSDSGPGSWLRRPQIAVSLVAVVLAGALVLAGWRTGWPTAVFGARHVAATQRLPLSPRSSPASPPAVAGTASTSPVPGPSSPGIASPTPASGPATVVTAYFAAINAKAYEKAWRLGGSNFGSSYASFVAGFDTTASDTVAILSVSGNVVTARLVAEQTDGTVKTFQGTYTVTGGVIASSDIQQVG
jgi:hypothetical protein